MITKHARNLANQFVTKRFGTKNVNKNLRIKFAPDVYKKDLLSHYYGGASQMAQEIARLHKEEPFNSVDEIIGELEILAGMCLDDFSKRIHDNPFKRKITTDSIISGQDSLSK